MLHKKQADLRRQAEKVLREQAEEPGKLAAQDIQSLIHELRTHRIELKMQNEEFRRAQIELEESRNRYSDLYDFAPVGYFTFDKNGRIIEVNLTGANKLGVERQFLIKKPFSIYIAPDSKSMFYLHIREVLRSESRQTCELKLVGKSGNQFYAQLESMAVREGKGKPDMCRTAISDITERKRAEETICESEERYRRLVESANDLIATVSPDGIITSLNPAFEKITGWAREEWLGKSFQSLIHPEDIPMAMNAFQRIMSGETLPGSELRLLASSGDYVYVEYETTALTKDGEVIGNLSIVRDITERKRTEEALRRAHDELEIRVEERTAELARTNEELNAEVAERKRAAEALRESEQKYRNLFDNAGDAIITIDPDARVTSWNQSAERIFGWTAGEAIGRELDELIVPRHMQAEFKKNVRDSIAGENITGIATVRQRKDGSRVDVGLTISAIKSAEGEIIGLSGIFRDITELKRAEEALRKTHDELELRVRERTAELEEANKALKTEITERHLAEDKIREQATLIEKAHDAIAVRDMENQLIYWNKSAEILYGWTKEEAMGKNADKFLYKEETPQLIEAKRNVLENGEWVGELRQLTKDGKDIIVASRWTLMRNHQGKPKSILIINTDITEKKKLEAQFLRAQRMESIGTLAGGIAHDLNNVLTPVMLSIQMLNEKFKDEQSQKLLDILQKNTQRGADLIKQVMSFARGIEGERKPLQVSHIISEIDKISKETFPRDIEIKTDISKDLWDIIGDATQLHQVVMNLCVNARDAMPDSGTLTISAGNVLIDEIYARMHIDARAGSYIIISISDTGTGIPPKIMDRIFEPFFTTKEPGKGTGLGLSTVLTIVKSHGGFIDVQSEVGRGTSFKVYLPAIAAAQTREENAPAPELQSGHGESILIVDDEASILEVTTATLEQNGYRVLAASDGVEAISLFVQNREEIKAVLMDMMMPVMDGTACIHALRKINPEVRIIGASGLTEKSKLEKTANIRVQAFLTKPYTVDMLLKTVREVISTE